jgi:hypothetical protein
LRRRKAEAAARQGGKPSIEPLVDVLVAAKSHFEPLSAKRNYGNNGTFSRLFSIPFESSQPIKES